MLVVWVPGVMIGGACPGGEDRTASFSTVERYTPKTNTWTEAPSMKGKRAGAGVTVCDGKIYVAGQSHRGVVVMVKVVMVKVVMVMVTIRPIMCVQHFGFVSLVC